MSLAPTITRASFVHMTQSCSLERPGCCEEGRSHSFPSPDRAEDPRRPSASAAAGGTSHDCVGLLTLLLLQKRGHQARAHRGFRSGRGPSASLTCSQTPASPFRNGSRRMSQPSRPRDCSPWIDAGLYRSQATGHQNMPVCIRIVVTTTTNGPNRTLLKPIERSIGCPWGWKEQRNRHPKAIERSAPRDPASIGQRGHPAGNHQRL